MTDGTTFPGPTARLPRGLASVGSLVFFVPFFLYLWLRVDPALIYHRVVSRFYLSDWRWIHPGLVERRFHFMPLVMYPESLAGFLYPGGLVEYLAAAISDTYYVSWLGALALTAAAWLLWLATAGLITALGGRRDNPLALVPAMLMLLLCNQFDNPLALGLGVLVALAAANGYLRLGARSAWTRLALFLAMSAVVYYVAGGAYLLFAVVCGLYELLHARRRSLGAVCLALGLLIPWLGATCWCPVEGTGAAARLLPLLAEEDGRLRLLRPNRKLSVTLVGLALTLLMALFVALCLPSRGGAGRARRRRAERSREGREAGERPTRLRRTTFDFCLVPLLMGVIAFAAAVPLFAARRAAVLRMDLAVEEGRWSDVLDGARRWPGGSPVAPIQHDVIHALYRTGRLPDDLFAYVQDIDGLILLAHERQGLDLSKQARTYFELGRVNEAERLAQNWLEGFGVRPQLLRLLARINIVKRRPAAARAYLAALRRFRYARPWADDLLRRLDDDPLLTSDPEVSRIRSVMLTDDDVIRRGWSDTEDRWLVLLKRNRKNRMAMEHLMAYYLLSLRPDKVAANIHRLDDFDYVGIPRHYEEAILLHRYRSKKEVDLHGRAISAETTVRFDAFLRDLAECRRLAPGNPKAGAEELRDAYGDTYYYYFLF